MNCVVLLFSGSQCALAITLFSLKHRDTIHLSRMETTVRLERKNADAHLLVIEKSSGCRRQVFGCGINQRIDEAALVFSEAFLRPSARLHTEEYCQ